MIVFAQRTPAAREADFSKRVLAVAVAAVLAVSAGTGCSTVDPSGDYKRASDQIRARTGTSLVYDPAADEQIDGQVAQLLDDGLRADEAVSVALLNNREFQQLFFEIGVSRAEVVQSGLLSNPSLFFNVLIPDGGGRSKLTFGIAQEIAELWQIPKRKKSANEKLEITVLNIERSAVAICMRAKVAYYNALATRMAAENGRKSEQLAEEAVSLVTKRFDAGDVSELDVNRARASLLAATTDVVTTTHESNAAKATLDRELGLSYWKDPYTLSDMLDTAAAPLGTDNDLIAIAASNVLDVALAKKNMDAAEAEVAAQRRAVFPSIKAGVGAERTTQRAIPSRVDQGVAAWKPSSVFEAIPDIVDQKLNGQTPLDTLQALQAGQPIVPTLLNQGIAQAGRFKTLKSALPNFPTQRQRELSEKQQIDFLWGPTLQVTLPLFDQNQAHIAIAQIRLQQKQKEYENTLELLAESVRQKASKMRAAEELAVFFADKAIPLAEQNAKGAELVYQAGQEGVLSVIDAQRELHSLRKTHIGVLRDYHVAKAELEQAMGGRIVKHSKDGEVGETDAK